MKLSEVREEIAQCEVCRFFLPNPPRPVLQIGSDARILIVGQAPGNKAHLSGVPWSDASGNRLRSWLHLSEEQFYNSDLVAITPMSFCFPGVDKNGGDLPPLPVCAPLWHPILHGHLSQVTLTLLIGSYAHKFYLKDRVKENLTSTVQAWREYGPQTYPLPHPSWRNTGWLKRNRWFEEDLLPELREKVAKATSNTSPVLKQC